MFTMTKSYDDFLTMASLAAQMLLLVLPVLGRLYIIYHVIRMPVMMIWNWSRAITTRRIAGTLGAAVIITLLGFLWSPQVQGLTESRATLTQTDKPDVLLMHAREATAKLQTLRADLEGSLGSDHFVGTIVLKRPNLARIDIKGDGGLEFLIVSDGKNRFIYFPEDNQYARTDSGSKGHNIQAFVAEQVDHFFRPHTIGATAAGGRFIYVGKERADGTEYDVIEGVTPGPRNKTARYLISTTDNLIHRVASTTKAQSGEIVTNWSHMKNISTDAPVDESIFRWEPPATAAPLQLPGGITLPFGRDASK